MTARKRRLPFVLQVGTGNIWYDTDRFGNRDEAVARMRNMPKNDAVSLRVIRDDGFDDSLSRGQMEAKR